MATGCHSQRAAEQQSHFQHAVILSSCARRINRTGIAHRDPRDTETIAPVNIQPTSWPDPLTSTNTNPTTHTIMVNVSERFEDIVILHEYGHHLESQISSVSNWPSYHDGCEARLFNGRTLINSPEDAWAEAFPDYFPRAVMRTYWNEPSYLHRPSALSRASSRHACDSRAPAWSAPLRRSADTCAVSGLDESARSLTV
jgi:hypothetical protein